MGEKEEKRKEVTLATNYLTTADIVASTRRGHDDASNNMIEAYFLLLGDVARASMHYIGIISFFYLNNI